MLVVGEYRNYFLKVSSMKVSQSFQAASYMCLCCHLLSGSKDVGISQSWTFQ